MRPAQQQAAPLTPATRTRLVCLYDNAGEHFQPGMDTAASPVTRHLARSRVLMFLYDPTQDPRFRERCRSFSHDPQLEDAGRTQRQETLLTEAALRVRLYAGVGPSQKYDRPLIVVVPKLDVWQPLLKASIDGEPIVESESGAKVDVARIEAVSDAVRGMLLEHAPEVVAAAEDFCQHVMYVPVSALGRAPEVQESTRLLSIRPRDIAPRWVTAPVLYMFAKWASGLVAST